MRCESAGGGIYPGLVAHLLSTPFFPFPPQPVTDHHIAPRPIHHFQYSQKFGGEKATSLVSYSKDPAVIAICETWAGDYDSSAVEALGFQVDSRETGYEDAVRDFVEELKKD